MLDELFASLSARLSAGRAHPFTHTWAASRWLQQHAQLDADERMQEYLAQASSFNASPKLGSPALAAFLQFDVSVNRCIRELIETYLAGNRAASKSVLRRLDDAARLFGATYELFYRAHRNGKPLIRKPGQLAQVILGMLHYRNLQSRVRLFHYDEPVPVLWQIASSLYRYAVGAGINRLAVYAPHRDGRLATIEGEYANLLMLARLASGSFTAQEIEHASVLLGEVADKLRLRADEPEHATFALEPDSLTGLVSAHGIRLTDRTLFLDPEPLFAHIRKRLADIEADEAGDALSRRIRTAWLERLNAHWQPDRKVVARRAERLPVDIPVALVPGLHNIHRELLAEMENAGEFWDTLIRSGRWRIVEQSPLDCRIQFENESAEQFPVGALISMRKEGAADWQIGVVRRVKRFEGNRIELGVEMIAREVKAIRLWHDTSGDVVPRPPGQGPDSNALVALYLPSSGAIPPAPARSLILRHSDYKSGQRLLHVAGNTRIPLVMSDAIEIGRGWVWTPFVVPARSPDLTGATPLGPDTDQGITSSLTERSMRGRQQ
jgi:hypothetical protein